MKLYLNDYLKSYAKDKPIRMHMPGHKASGRFCKLFPTGKKDITEIESKGLYSAIENAHKDLRSIYGVGFVKILTDGATSGVLSMINAVKDLGDSLIVQKSSHKSVYNALEINGIKPIFTKSSLTEGLYDLPSAEETAKLLDANKNAIGVLYTYPDYYGRTFDLCEIAKEVHDRGKILLIDNSHGGHFAFMDKVVYAGAHADIWVDSLHKVFSTLNQGALLMAKDKKWQDKLEESAQKFITTSPSYPIMASCEYGVKERLEEKISALKLEKIIEKQVEKLKESKIYTLVGQDLFKIVINVEKSRLDRVELLKKLEKAKIYYELFDGKYMIFMLSAKTKKSQVKKLCKVLKSVRRKDEPLKTDKQNLELKTKLDYISALKLPSEEIDLTSSEKRVLATNCGITPPCYPLAVAGEVITSELIETLLDATNKNKAFGVINGKIKVIKKENL